MRTALDHRFAAIMSIGLLALLAGYAAIWWLAPISGKLLGELWFMPGIGLFGATIANTSGTGGGVVFVPVFSILRHAGIMSLDSTQVVATSFLIQCFGMTIGALRWSTGLYREQAVANAPSPRDYWTIVGIVVLFSMPAMLVTQRMASFSPHDVLLAFKGFSIVLGLAVIGTTWTVNRDRLTLARVAGWDFVVLAAIGLIGGFVTALFSVGVGEVVALYLFIRHYPVTLCTGTAVTISSLLALSAAPFHIWHGNVVWEVVVLAALGAALGGYLARPFALWLGANRLKTLDGCWIVVSSLYLIVLNVT